MNTDKNPIIIGTTAKWEWYVFGGKKGQDALLLVTLPYDIPWWRRLLCRVLLGSSFERVDK